MRTTLAVVLFLLAGCHGEGPRDDVLRVGVPALPASWGDPYRAEGGPPAHTWIALFDALTRIGPDGTLQPALARSWASEDGLRWVFNLRRDVRYSNGTPLDAECAAATFNWLLSPQGRTTVMGARLRGLSEVRAEGKYVLVLKSEAPHPNLPRLLSGVAIVEPSTWRRLGAAGFARAPVGTGPYRLVRFDDRRREAILERNPYAWRRARTPRLRIIELPDESVRNQALISGHIDLTRVGIDALELLSNRGIRVMTPPAMQVMAIALITEGRVTPLDDVRVRQALNLAIDKQAIAQSLLGGRGIASGQPASPATDGHDPGIPPYPYNPARARELLRQAGYPDGFPMRIEGVTGVLPGDTSIYQAVVWYLSQIGVAATFRASSFATLIRRNQTGEWDGIDAFASPWNSAPYNDVQRPMEAYSCIKPKPYFCDPSLAEELRQARIELDPERRTERLRALSRRYHAQAVSIFLVDQIDVFGYSKRIRNLVISNRIPVYEDIELER